MRKIYRIHGDNIVECERIANLIINEVHPRNVEKLSFSPATISESINFYYSGKYFEWSLELLLDLIKLAALAGKEISSNH